MARRQTPAPEWLGKRLDYNADRWTHTNAPALIASTLGDARRGQVNATTDPSAIGTLLRSFALVQARYGLDNLDDMEERNTRDDMETAYTYWLQELTNRATGSTRSKWSDGTGSALARSIATLSHPADAFDAALPHLMTANSRAILQAVGKQHPETQKALQQLRAELTKRLPKMPPPSTHGEREQDRRELTKIADIINKHRRNHDARRARRGNSTTTGKGRESKRDTGRPMWIDLRHSPNKLGKQHAGKIGTARRFSDTGRSVRHPSRALTDPARRVFDRRQRARNALIVLDMSGSMNHTTRQLDEILEHARGAVVVGYSHTGEDHDNFHLLAKDGQRVAQLPKHGGSNGLDGLALSYAVNKYRKNATTPIVWVSDGQVNGIGDCGELARDMINRLQQTGAHHVETTDDAIALLDRMAQGHRPAPKIGQTLINWARGAY